MSRTPWRASALVALALAGCGGGDSDALERVPDQISLVSPAFRDGGTIPTRYTCDGEGLTPTLRWPELPEDTREMALLVEDPDAPDGTFAHWILFKLPTDSGGLDEGFLPEGVRHGENSAGENDWAPPCPPEGDEPHRYRFVVYALREPIDLEDGASADDVRGAIADAAIARGTLVGTFGR